MENSNKLKSDSVDLMDLVRKAALERVPEELVKFNTLLEQRPKADWIKKNDGIPYIPIRIVEDLLTSFFGDWSAEFPEGGTPRVAGNSIVCSIILKVVNPVTGVERRLPGVGAVPIQLQQMKTDNQGNYISGKRNNLDFENVVVTAIQKNAPAALSFAISNAAKKLGRIFGANITQDADFYLGIHSLYSRSSSERNSRVEIDRVSDFISKCNTEDEIQMLLADPSVDELVLSSQELQGVLKSKMDSFEIKI